MCLFVICHFIVFFFKQKTAYDMRISDWSSDVCSSDLRDLVELLALQLVAAHAALDDRREQAERAEVDEHREEVAAEEDGEEAPLRRLLGDAGRSEERRVGKGCVSTGRARWAAEHSKKRQNCIIITEVLTKK